MERGATVRCAVPGDVDAITALRLSVRGPPEDARVWAERAASGATEGRVVHVGCIGGAVVAYGVAARFVPPPDAPSHVAPPGHYLVGLVVHPDFRRRGVATALVRARLAWIEPRAPRAWYFTDDANVASIALHAPFGFTAVTTRFWFPGIRDESAPMTLYARDRPDSERERSRSAASSG